MVEAVAVSAASHSAHSDEGAGRGQRGSPWYGVTAQWRRQRRWRLAVLTAMRVRGERSDADGSMVEDLSTGGDSHKGNGSGDGVSGGSRARRLTCT